MRYQTRKPMPVRSKVCILTGGVKEDVSQLELKPGELLDCVNYEEIEGAYHGYRSIGGYERFDGQGLASEVELVGLNDHGNDESTVLLLESNKPATIEDLSSSAHTITNTLVTEDTLKYKFPNSSFYFNGTSNLAVTPVDTSLDLVDNDFTIDLLITPYDVTSDHILLQKGMSYKLSIESGKVVFRYSTDGVGWSTTVLTSATTVVVNETLHFSIIRKDTDLYMSFDGTKDTNSASISTDIIYTVVDDLVIGSDFLGRMDEIRVSSVYRWIFDYTIPDLPYSDANYIFFQYDDEAREAQRELIQPLPGTGPVRLVAHNQGEIGAVRDYDANIAYIYRADPTGWSSPMPGAFVLEFNTGKDTTSPYDGFQVGETITGTPSGATAEIADIEVYSGDWQVGVGGDATGRIALKNVSGGPFVNGDVLDNGATATANLTADTYGEYALTAGGDYKFVNGQFSYLVDLQRVSTPFLVNGVNPPVYYDGTQIIPILDTLLPDHMGVYATSVAVFKERLWLAYPDGQLWFSAVGDPLDWDIENSGAGFIYMEDEITDLVVAPGDSLVIFCKNSIQIIKSVTDIQSSSTGIIEEYKFRNEAFSRRSGAKSKSVNRLLGEIYFLDDRGLTNLTATDAYGDFSTASMSKNIQKTLFNKLPLFTTAATDRQSNQYILFFSDATGIIFTLDAEKKIKGATKITFNHNVLTYTEMEDTDGNVNAFFGSSNGYVYKANSGTSFDGAEIETSLTTSYYSYNSPNNWKRFHKITLEVQGVKGLEFVGRPYFNYNDPNIPRSIDETYISSGQGGTWGVDAWGYFIYGAGEVQNPALYLGGYGTNMSMKITTSDKYLSPHVLNSFTTEYTMNSRRM